MPPDYEYMFSHQADVYDRFVSAEDHTGNLAPTLRRLGRLNSGMVVADLGTGTGRVARLLASHVRQVLGVEPAPAMLAVAKRRQVELGTANLSFGLGEHKATGLADQSVDLVVEGWAFLRAFNVAYDHWRTEFQAILYELKRIVRPPRPVLLIETMGSVEIWTEPPGRVAELYTFFERELGLQREVIRTDYRFHDPNEAVEMAEFFFGPVAAEHVRKSGSDTIPEATAIWHGNVLDGAGR